MQWQELPDTTCSSDLGGYGAPGISQQSSAVVLGAYTYVWIDEQIHFPQGEIQVQNNSIECEGHRKHHIQRRSVIKQDISMNALSDNKEFSSDISCKISLA